MKVIMASQCQEDPDGVDEEIYVTREVNTIHDMLDLFSSFCRASGYSYVDRVGYATNKGAETWSKF